MLPHDDLAEVGASLKRTELDALNIVDRHHRALVESYFDAKGPLRYVLYARAEDLIISFHKGKHTAADFIQFCRFLRNCFVYSLQLYANAYFDVKNFSELCATKATYVAEHIELRCSIPRQVKLFLEAIPQSHALHCNPVRRIRSQFYRSSTVRSIRHLTLTQVRYLHEEAAVEWLHAPTENGGDRRLTLHLTMQPPADPASLVALLKKEFLRDTESRDFHLFVFGYDRLRSIRKSETLENEVGDVLEIEPFQRDRFNDEFCVRRRSGVHMVAATDEPEVWDFRTVKNFEKSLVSKVTEV